MQINKVLKFSLPSLVLAGGISFSVTYDTNEVNATEILDKAATQLEKDGIEYIKTTNPDGSYTEYWKDTYKLKERMDTYLADGTLLNSTIVTDGGSRVVTIGNDQGEIAGSTWTLPQEIVQQNEKSLKKSALEELKQELKSDKWKFKEEVKIKDKTFKKISIESKNYEEVLTIDETTGLAVKREAYQIDAYGEKKLVKDQVEHYNKIKHDDKSDDIFKAKSNVDIKEIKKDIYAPSKQ